MVVTSAAAAAVLIAIAATNESASAIETLWSRTVLCPLVGAVRLRVLMRTCSVAGGSLASDRPDVWTHVRREASLFIKPLQIGTVERRSETWRTTWLGVESPQRLV